MGNKLRLLLLFYVVRNGGTGMQDIVKHSHTYSSKYNTCLKQNLGITETCIWLKTLKVPGKTSSTYIKQNLPAVGKL